MLGRSRSLRVGMYEVGTMARRACGLEGLDPILHPPRRPPCGTLWAMLVAQADRVRQLARVAKVLVLHAFGILQAGGEARVEGYAGGVPFSQGDIFGHVGPIVCL